MIAFVRGIVAQAAGDHLVVDIGPLGLVVQCTPATALAVGAGDHVHLQTTMVVREDSWTLYGFEDSDDRAVFEQVQTVSGIGPRIALALLGTLSPDELRAAIATGNETALTKVPGIGRKGAQRLILELRDKLGPATGTRVAALGASVPASAPGTWEQSVQSALVSLGWSTREADAAVASLDAGLVESCTSDPATPDIARLLKAALRGLDRT